MQPILPRARIHLLAAVSGLAALSWEVLWQIKSSLALGVSAWGTAITLAATMGGMSFGSFLMGRILGDKNIQRPVRIYAALEILIGFTGLCLGWAFRVIEGFDTWVYGANADAAPLVHILAILIVLGIPTACMGATLPVFGLVAKQFQTSIAALYGLNTLGAAAGALIAAFILIPALGVTHTIWAISGVNFAVGVIALTLGQGTFAAIEVADVPEQKATLSPSPAQIIVLVTGFATFVLEVAWFRSLTAAFFSTTTTFAVILAVVLLALGLGARLAPIIKRLNVPLGVLLGWAGMLVLFATPILERFDIISYSANASFTVFVFNQFMMTLFVVGPAVLLMGMALPWILNEQVSSRSWGRFYALNTLAAIAGSLVAAWLFLPTIGFARTSWLVGILVAVVGILIMPRRKQLLMAALACIALMVAVSFESGIGKTRAQGHLSMWSSKPKTLLESYEGPEATVSAVEYENGGRALVVNGFVTAGQYKFFSEHYMAWMGHLPMLLNPDPRNALVICFGTGQTLNAVRQENPQSVDIVDINPRVLKLAHNFSANQDVLSDPRAKVTIMDGRAYMRRTRKMYDVITLEPMPPNFAGVNALYDREFYALARQRLNPHGIIAQWLPYHLITTASAAAIVRTFMDVFPNAILWIDPASTTGILLGSADAAPSLGTGWPGFARTPIKRDLSEEQVKKAVLLSGDTLRRYAAAGAIVDDDNQLLAYGKAAEIIVSPDPDLSKENFDYITQLTGVPAPKPVQ